MLLCNHLHRLACLRRSAPAAATAEAFRTISTFSTSSTFSRNNYTFNDRFHLNSTRPFVTSHVGKPLRLYDPCQLNNRFDKFNDSFDKLQFHALSATAKHLNNTLSVAPNSTLRPQLQLRSVHSMNSQADPSSDPNSFHGISLPDDNVEASSTQSSSSRSIRGSNKNSGHIQEAEIVQSQNQKKNTRELIAELVKAELSSHFVALKSEEKKDENNVKSGDVDGNNNGSVGVGLEPPKYITPYERRIKLLEQAQQYHQTFNDSNNDKLLEYAQSCMNMGDLYYQLGQIEQSQEIYLEALKLLLNLNHDSTTDDITIHNKYNIQLMTAQIMHSLGAIHARCGEFSDAHRWYEESITRKRAVLLSNANDHHHEIGKTYNGLAALQVMAIGGSGSAEQWERAMDLFEEAEKNYVCHYYGVHPELIDKEADDDQDNDEESYDRYKKRAPPLTPQIIEKMAPSHIQAIVNIRSNMGELLRQRKNFDDAVNKLQSALELAQMDVECMHNKETENKDNPTEPSIHDINNVNNVNDPSPDERRNAVVDLLMTIADVHMTNENYDEAAFTYERALRAHLFYRRVNHGLTKLRKFVDLHHGPADYSKKSSLRNNTTNFTHTSSGSAKYSTNSTDDSSDSTNLLESTPPATNADMVPTDIENATTIEAAIRNNLASCLAQIGQNSLSLQHYEASLEIKRRVGGEVHLEVAHTLMGMGALLGGPMKDVLRALSCFKEAMYIYRVNLNELGSTGNDLDAVDEGAGGSGGRRNEKGELKFFEDEEEAKQIEEYIQNARKNIELINTMMSKKKR